MPTKPPAPSPHLVFNKNETRDGVWRHLCFSVSLVVVQTRVIVSTRGHFIIEFQIRKYRSENTRLVLYEKDQDIRYLWRLMHILEQTHSVLKRSVTKLFLLTALKKKNTLLICIAAIESVLSPQIGCISYFDINRHLERVSSRLRDVCIYTRTCLMFYDLHRERLPTIGLYHILNLPFCGFEWYFSSLTQNLLSRQIFEL